MAEATPALSQLTPEQRKQLEEKLKSMTPEQLKDLQKQQCIFCQIVLEKVPAKKVYEDETCLVILDINPAARGHLLLLPKEHYAILPQIPDALVGRLFTVAQKMSRLLLKALHADGTSIFLANGAIAGQRAQHVIIHVIPRKEGDALLPLEEKLLDQHDWEKSKELVQEKTAHLLQQKTSEEKVEKRQKPKKEKKKEEKEEQKEDDSPEDPEENHTEEDKHAHPEEEKVSEEKASEEKVSLDDIADLFK